MLPLTPALKADLAMSAWLAVGFFTLRVAWTQHRTAGQPSHSAIPHSRAGAQGWLLCWRWLV